MPQLPLLALTAAMLWPALGAQAATAQLPDAGAGAQREPVTLLADEIRNRPDRETIAEGHVELQSGGITIRTDRLTYNPAEDRAHAQGQVRIATVEGDLFSGPELQITLQHFEGFLLQPDYFFARTAAGGHAERIDFLDRQRARLTGATYTSCGRDNEGTPDWLLSTDRVELDFAHNEGIAAGAVLRFLGVPILAAPTLSFPLSDARKSGWLPPSINIDNKSGLELAVPYYWNIAPQRDATLTPIVYTRRGLGLNSELRYLEPQHRGEVQLHGLPGDQVFGASRYALQWQQQGRLASDAGPWAWRWGHEGLRVSDDSYWKDFPRELHTLTPRLLPLATRAEGDVSVAGLSTTLYARTQHWQVLQDADPLALIVAPYNRAPQIGWRGAGQLPVGGRDVNLAFETEINRFTRPGNDVDPTRPQGWRAHLLASASQTWRTPGAWLTPRLALNLAHYRTDTPMSDGRLSAARAIPTLSVEGGLLFDRPVQWSGRSLTQTLEPRLLYVNTPLRAQAALPLFDTAVKDFNTVSVFSDNAFAGVDRVSDAHQITAGISSRLLDDATGTEALRLGVAQRYLLRDQQITPDGLPLTQHFSDVLLVGAAHLNPRWTFETALQYSPQINRTTRSLLSMRYSPQPLRTVSASYRLVRGASEQIDVGWQWPVYRRAAAGVSDASANRCSGTLYSVGRFNYSIKDSRVTDSLAGLEYDAGCWIGRLVAERVSTGRAEATTRLLLQLELVGLSRLGSNPLQVLKDNIPGYRLLRDDRSDPPPHAYTP
jgi:LPS-assembly protein